MLRKLAAATAVMVAIGTSYLTGPASATIDPNLPVPSPPSVSVSGDAAQISWTPVAGAGGYRVQISLNGGRFGDVGDTDAATYSIVAHELRSPSLGCSQGPCTVRAQVATVNGAWESGFSAPSAPVAIPLPYAIPMSVARRNGAGKVTLELYGASHHPGQVVHLLMMSRERIWEDTGRTTTVRVQRVPRHARPILAWSFKIVVRSHGLSNYRVEVPAAGQTGEGLSRPYGVRR